MQLAFASDSAVIEAPPGFGGSVFVLHVLYNAAESIGDVLGSLDQAMIDPAKAETWRFQSRMESYLQRNELTHPTSLMPLYEPFANGEVALNMNHEQSRFGSGVDGGPNADVLRSHAIGDGTLGHMDDTLIPCNPGTRGAAIVLQSGLLSGDAQIEEAPRCAELLVRHQGG